MARVDPDGFRRLGPDFVRFREKSVPRKFYQPFVGLPLVAAAVDFRFGFGENAVWESTLKIFFKYLYSMSEGDYHLYTRL